MNTALLQSTALPVGELTPVPPNESGATQCIVRWQVETSKGWLGAYDKEAFSSYLAAARPQPVLEPLPLMSEAFRTTVAHGPSEDYRMVFKFKDLDSLHAADGEWRKFRSAP